MWRSQPRPHSHIFYPGKIFLSNIQVLQIISFKVTHKGWDGKDDFTLWRSQGQVKSYEAEFKEFEPRIKYGWFHLKTYSIFQDLSRRSIETGFWQI